jgi:molybdopterin-guanine dinucleotide biosynthesis protein A
MKDITVAVLAGGKSKRFGCCKALVEFQGKALVQHMLMIAKQISPRVLIVTNNEEREKEIRPLAGKTPIFLDPDDAVPCALTGTLTAFEHAETEYVQLLPVDSPLVRPEMIRFLARLAKGHGAVVPAWPSGYIEPLHSVYLAEHAYANGLKVMNEKKYRMSDLLDRLRNVLRVSTEVLKQYDEKLVSFTNFNTPQDLDRTKNKGAS